MRYSIFVARWAEIGNEIQGDDMKVDAESFKHSYIRLGCLDSGREFFIVPKLVPDFALLRSMEGSNKRYPVANIL